MEFYIIFTMHSLTNQKLHTNEIHYAFSRFIPLPPHMFQPLQADNNGCIVKVGYEPPEDGLVRAETYVGVRE
jgi:hypothetical protein